MTDFAALLRGQAEASPHIQFIYDVALARVVFINAAYGHVLGGNPARVNDEAPALLARLHPDDGPYLAHYWKLLTQGKVTDEVEVRLLCPGQRDQIFCLTAYHQATGPDGALVHGDLRDISVSKHNQQYADAFNARKNAALEIMSHDLSGAFSLVQQITQYLVEEVAVPPQGRVAEMLHVLETTSRNGLKLVRDLVSIEFLSAVNTDLKLDRVEVGAALREPLEQLQQGQTNLVSNAFKFTPDGGLVSVQVEVRPGCVRFHVRDQCIGIPAASLPHLFERFTTARRPGLRGEPTTGLGLALCKTIVEWHHGTISVVSTEGSGSTFTVEIPQAL
jgi:two-component system sensor histidine kinase VicK